MDIQGLPIVTQLSQKATGDCLAGPNVRWMPPAGATGYRLHSVSVRSQIEFTGESLTFPYGLGDNFPHRQHGACATAIGEHILMGLAYNRA